MKDHEAEAGHELVLDNRKLILIFVVLIAFCGCFFVVGFMEGKRQGFQDGVQTATEAAKKTTPGETQAQDAAPGSIGSGAVPGEEPAQDSQLAWYNSVNRNDGESETSALSESPVPEKKEAPPVKASAKGSSATGAAEPVKKASAEPAPKVLPQVKAAAAGDVTYSVQVGAFRVRREVETKAKELRAKGFSSRIEVPQSSDGLYLLKVGKFSSRADAAAMQLRLKKSGIAESFVKIN